MNSVTTGKLGSHCRKTVFLISSGRTGTKAIANYFKTCYPDVTAHHEPVPSRYLRITSNKYICGKISPERAVRILRKSREKLISESSGKVYFESNPYLHGFIDSLDEVFDKPLLIHVVRDPRTYIRSYMNFGVFKGIKKLFAEYCPYWMIKPDLYERNPVKKWKEMSDIEKIAWRWKTVNTELNKAETLFGTRYIRITYEDLFNRDGSGVAGVAQWIGLPNSEELKNVVKGPKIHASTGQNIDKWDAWAEEDREMMLKYCTELMKVYGYL